jgi:hypothetical protein
MVIGDNLYQITRNLCEYDYNFTKIDEYPIDDNPANQYSVYSITSKDEKSNDKKKKLYKKIV